MASRKTAAKAAKTAQLADSAETPPVVQVEQWDVSRLRGYERNSRTRTSADVSAIAASIKQFGFTNPILVRADGTIAAGHGRLAAATRLKMKTVPVIVMSGWSDAQFRAYVIADNRLALNAGWDEEILKLELGDLAEANFDLELTGFKEDDLNQLFGKVQEQLTPPEIKQQFQILITCKSEAEQLELLEDLQGRAVECRALIS